MTRAIEGRTTKIPQTIYSLMRTLTLLLVLSSQLLAQEQAGSLRLAVREKILGNTANLIGSPGVGFCVFASPDNERVAYGVSSPRNAHRGSCAVIDGKLGPDYFGPNYFQFSPDSKRVGYRAFRLDGGKCMVIDGSESQRFDHLGYGDLIFSPDSRHYAYVAARGNKQFVVFDGQEGKGHGYDVRRVLIRGILFSPDSAHCAYHVKDKEDECELLVDGKVVLKAETFWRTCFSPDSRRFACVAKRGDKGLVFIDGVEAGSSEVVNEDLQFSPDSKHLIHTSRRDGKRFVVMDGKEGAKYDEVGSEIRFSADSRQLVYTAKKMEKWFLVVNQVEGLGYDRIGLQMTDSVGCFVGNRWFETLCFSPDSKRLAFPAVRNSKAFVVVDGAESKSYDAICAPKPVFSPDSKRLAYVAERSGKCFVVVDGVEGKSYDKHGGNGFVPITDLLFSPDSKHVVYQVFRNNAFALVVDGVETPEFQHFPVGGRVVFDKPNLFHTIVASGGDLLRMEVEIVQQ